MRRCEYGEYGSDVIDVMVAMVVLLALLLVLLVVLLLDPWSCHSPFLHDGALTVRKERDGPGFADGSDGRLI